jgi:predicted nucleic acid-binding protein
MTAEFCDTNVIVYAHDAQAGAKRERAVALLTRLWVEGTGVVSVQILQEVFVALTRKVRQPIAAAPAREVVALLATWRIVAPTHQDVLFAIDATDRWQLSFWDAMIVVAAQKARASVLWSEDLSHGQVFGEVTVRNPFRV